MTTVTLSAEDVRAAISMPEAIEAVRDAIADLHGGEFEQPTRTVLRDGAFLVMSAHHRPTSSAMVKTLSLNFERTPAITGTVVWTDTASVDHIVADAGSVTTLRTGAIVGVATDLLADKDANRLVIIGAGGQAPDQIRAVHAVRPLRSLTVVDATPGKADHLIDGIRAELPGVEVSASDRIDEAVSDTDIICCATSTTTPLFAADILPPRVHVNAIGAFRPTMRELPSELLADASIVIDETQAILEESGEIIHALNNGLIRQDDLTELGVLLNNRTVETKKRTVFKTVGIAAQDWAIARALAGKFLPSA